MTQIKVEAQVVEIMETDFPFTPLGNLVVAVPNQYMFEFRRRNPNAKHYPGIYPVWSPEFQDHLDASRT